MSLIAASVSEHDDISLACYGLHLRLGRKSILHGLSTSFTSGCLTIIVGPNGAGKTTWLRTLSGLVTPDRGQVMLKGQLMIGLSARSRARALGYLPQHGSIVWPLTVREVVALGRLPHGERPARLSREGRAIVDDVLSAVDLAGFEDRASTTLSGGERARMLLARVLAGQPEVLLADEPLASLDPRHQLQMMALMRAEAQRGRTIIMTLHDLALAARYADRVLVLDKGHLVADGAPSEALSPACLKDVFGVDGVRVHQGGTQTIVPWALSADETLHPA